MKIQRQICPSFGLVEGDPPDLCQTQDCYRIFNLEGPVTKSLQSIIPRIKEYTALISLMQFTVMSGLISFCFFVLFFALPKITTTHTLQLVHCLMTITITVSSRLTAVVYSHLMIKVPYHVWEVLFLFANQNLFFSKHMKNS